MAGEISKHELSVFSKIGRSLWQSPEQCKAITSESLSAASLLNLTEEEQINRAVKLLLVRFRKMGMAQNSLANFSQGFASLYRLSPEQRFVLVALHLGNWSYKRIAAVLQCSEDDVQEWAIRSRQEITQKVLHGTRGAKATCPEYSPSRPWTQRFLDEEFKAGRERAFFQNHLMACSDCRGALQEARVLFFEIDQILNRFSAEASGETENLVESFERILKMNPTGPRSFWVSWFLWMQTRKDAWVALGILVWVFGVLIGRALR